MFMTRFWPITASPTRPISAMASFIQQTSLIPGVTAGNTTPAMLAKRLANILSTPFVEARQKLNGVHHRRDARLQMGAQLGHAAYVARDNDVWLNLPDQLSLVLSEPRGDGGLLDVVGPCRSTAYLCVAQFHEFDTRHGPEKFTRLIANPLPVSQVARVVICDAQAGCGVLGSRRPQTDPREIGTHVQRDSGEG